MATLPGSGDTSNGGAAQIGGTPSSASPLRVLLVEGEGLVAMMLEEVLVRAGHQVVAVRNAAAAEAAWAAGEATGGKPFDALVVDLGAPGQPFENLPLLRRLRTARPTLPVVVMTGYAMTAAELRRRLGRHARASQTAILARPFDPAELPAALARAVAASARKA